MGFSDQTTNDIPSCAYRDEQMSIFPYYFILNDDGQQQDEIDEG